MCKNRIKESLAARGISQTELANRFGKTFNMVNLYASNKVQPPIPVLYQIADIVCIGQHVVFTIHGCKQIHKQTMLLGD